MTSGSASAKRRRSTTRATRTSTSTRARESTNTSTNTTRARAPTLRPDPTRARAATTTLQASWRKRPRMRLQALRRSVHPLRAMPLLRAMLPGRLPGSTGCSGTGCARPRQRTVPRVSPPPPPQLWTCARRPRWLRASPTRPLAPRRALESRGSSIHMPEMAPRLISGPRRRWGGRRRRRWKRCARRARTAGRAGSRRS